MEHQHNASTAPGWCVTEAQDADEHAHNLRDWQQEYDQLGCGRFYGRIDELALPDVQLFREHTSHALRQQCTVWPDSLWLGLAVNPQSCRINGEPVAASEVMCRPGSLDFELLTPDDFDIYGIVVRQQELQRLAEVQGVEWSDEVWQTPKRGSDPQVLQALRQDLHRLLTLAAMNGPRLPARLQQELMLTRVLDWLQASRQPPHPAPSHGRRRQVVERVREYVRANPDELLTITDLCERVHVSRRTLQYSFESVLGISPLKFLRLVRLNAVRRQLSRPVPESQWQPLASIAARWGFWHPGEFARDYRDLFGENPSVTRERASRMAAE